MDSNKSFKEFLVEIKDTVLKALKYQEYPYALLVDELKPKTPKNRNPFYDVALVFQDVDMMDEQIHIEAGEKIKVTPYNFTNSSSKLDLSYHVSKKDEIRISIEFATDLFHTDTIEKFSNDLMKIINSVLKDSEKTISELIWQYSGIKKHEMINSANEEISENF